MSEIDRIYREPVTRRDLIRIGGTGLAATTLLGTALAACGNGGSSGLTLGVSPDVVEIIKGELPAYEKQSGVSVDVQTFPEDTDQYFDRVRTQLQGGSSTPDVFMGDVSWPAQLGANGWLEDLTDRFTAEERSAFLAAPIAANVYDGKVYGVPFFTDVGLLWYRKDLLSKSGFASPPGTWDELQQMATKVMADSGTRNGHVFTGAVYEGGTVLGTEFIRSAGGNVLDGNEVVITSPEAIRGLTFERELVTSGVSPEAVADFQEDQVSGEFLNGNSVFMRNWPYVFGILSDPEQSDIDPSQVGVTYVPVADSSVPRTNVGGGWNLFINASSQMKEAAWNLVQFIAATPQQKRLSIKGSYLPTRKDLYQDHQIISTLPAVAQAKKEIFETTTPPVSPFYSDISHAMADQFNQSLRGSITPSEAANNIADQIDQIMQKAANQ